MTSKKWTKEETEYLQGNNHRKNKELAIILGRTENAIMCKRRRCGISSTHFHGFKKTRIYRIWKGMRQRCSNPKIACYHRYGGRGIFVCEEWQKSFISFKCWAINNGYRDDLSIDRIDNDGNYCPGNCRWATRKEQNNNQSRNKR